jgi:hypothetical protein
VRIPVLKALLASVCLTIGTVGCIPIAYVYPKVDHVSVSGLQTYEPDMNTQPGIAAFLVRTSVSGKIPVATTETTISTIPISDEGDAKHLRVTLESGAILKSVLSYGWFSAHHMQLSLFRPGFKTIEVDSDVADGDVNWIRVVNAAKYESAVDQILSVSEHDIKDVFQSDPIEDQQAIVRIDIRGEREGLLRMAAEYSRLLNLIREHRIPATSESFLSHDSLNDVKQEITEMSSKPDLTEDDQTRLESLHADLDFETRWADPVSRLEAKIEWLELKASSTY